MRQLTNVQDRFKTLVNKGIPTRAYIMSYAVLALVIFATDPVAAQTNDFYCEGGLNTILSGLLTLFLTGGPLIGTIVAVFAQFASSASTEKKSQYEEIRTKALKRGWGVPILIFGGGAIGQAIGINFACILPSI